MFNAAIRYAIFPLSAVERTGPMLHKIIPALLAPLLAFAAAGQDAAPKTIFESKALLPNGTFEAASPVENGGTAHPAGWMLESPADGAPDLWAADMETALQGGASLRLAGGVQPVRVASDPMVLDAEFTSLGVVAMCRGAGGTAPPGPGRRPPGPSTPRCR